MYDDLRDWLKRVHDIGKLRTIQGADWDLEICAASALNQRKPDCPALLFDSIKGYPPGFRVLTCTGATPRLVSANFGLPPIDSDLDLLGTLRASIPRWEAEMPGFAPEATGSGPILENVLSGKDVDLFRFPAPRWYPRDGGRYIGTGHVVITRDRDTGEVNLGTYRVQIIDKKTTGLFLLPGQDASGHLKKYHDRGEPCPVAVSLGHHPLLFRVGSLELPPGMEYHFAGAVRGEPVKVIAEEVTGLPVPADSEIVLAGWSPPGVRSQEGPFGEWTGYYSPETRSPVIQVERIYYRNDPILLGSVHDRPEFGYFRSAFRSALLQNDLVRKGVPGIKAVWLARAGGPMLVIISIKQEYAGHARDVALAAASSGVLRRQGRYVIVVDDDIDPTNMAEVLWAVSTRSEPKEAIQVLNGASGDRSNIKLSADARLLFHSKANIIACRPYGEKAGSLEPVAFNPDVVARVKERWKDLS